MATTYKVLGQSNPSAQTSTALYTVPSSTSTVVSTLTVSNLGSAPTTYRIAVSPAGAALEDKHYIVYDSSIAQQDSNTITIGLTLATTDVVRVWSFNNKLAFNLFGSEIS